MIATAARRSDRRRHPRLDLGLPVRVHFAGRALPLTVEMADVSKGGCFFRGASAPAASKLAFGFVLPGRRFCVARGEVVRVAGGGFGVKIAQANAAFADFVETLSALTTAATPRNAIRAV